MLRNKFHSISEQAGNIYILSNLWIGLPSCSAYSGVLFTHPMLAPLREIMFLGMKQCD